MSRADRDDRQGAAERPAQGAGGVRFVVQALGLGALYSALVFALLLLGRVATGFIYQGF